MIINDSFNIFFNNFLYIFIFLFAIFLIFCFINFVLKQGYKQDLWVFKNTFGISTENNKWFKYRRVIKSKNIKFVTVFFVGLGITFLISLIISLIFNNNS